MSTLDPVIAFVVAVANNGVIGRDGGLPWRMPSDLRMFRRSHGKPVIMGRRTFNSLKRRCRARQHRDNHASRDAAGRRAGGRGPGGGCAHRRRLRPCAGGIGDHGYWRAEIFAALLEQADRIYLTRIDATPDGDTLFPTPDPAAWQEHPGRRSIPIHATITGAALIVLERRGTP